MYTDGTPGPDGPASNKASDNWNSDPCSDKGEVQMSADLSTVKRSIRSLF